MCLGGLDVIRVQPCFSCFVAGTTSATSHWQQVRRKLAALQRTVSEVGVAVACCEAVSENDIAWLAKCVAADPAAEVFDALVHLEASE